MDTEKVLLTMCHVVDAVFARRFIGFCLRSLKLTKAKQKARWDQRTHGRRASVTAVFLWPHTDPPETCARPACLHWGGSGVEGA